MFLIITIISIIIFVYKVRNFIHRIHLSNKLDGPPAYPLIGNGLLFCYKTPPENFTVLSNVLNEYKKNILRLWIGPTLIIFFREPKDIEAIMNNTKYIEKSDEYKYVKSWLNDGLLISKGKKWFQRRKIITPAFHFNILENFVDIFERQGDTFIKLLRKDTQDGSSIALYPYVTLCALDVICEAAMGVTINAQINSDSRYVQAIKHTSYVSHLRMFDFIKRIDFFYQFTSLARDEKDNNKILHDFSTSVIVERRKELLKQNGYHVKGEDDSSGIGIKKKMAFLDILLQSNIEGKPLSNDDIQEEVNTFMFEGHDTTTSAITFCLYNLAKYPEIQGKCFNEVNEIFGGRTPDHKTTLHDLNQLNYLELVIKESLRLFPSVPLIARKLNETIEISGQKIPAGSNVAIPIYWLGRDPKIFENPNDFIPERFNVESSAEKFNPYGYIPFSAGPRNCIGQKFAMFEIKSIVAKCLLNFNISLAKDQEEPILIAELILKSDNKINFILTARQ